MKLNENFRKILIKDFELAISQMGSEKDPRKIIYYFSAISGSMNRIFNLQFSQELVYLHHIFKSVHEAFIQRLSALVSGADPIVQISDKQFSQLIDLTRMFAERFKNKKNYDAILKKLIVLSYSTTGNGYYLMINGKLKLE